MQLQKPHDGGGTFDTMFACYVAGAAIASKQTVIWSTAALANDLGRVVLPGVVDSYLFAGVAQHAAAIGEPVFCTVMGVIDDATTDGAVTVGVRLQCGAAGVLLPWSPILTDTTTLAAEIGRIHAIALETDVGTEGKVYITSLG